MDSAIGVPEELAEKDRSELTPMITQYVELCASYDTELVLFHVGDFYKAFGEAAEVVARICELNLTTREDNTGEYAMAGLRVDNAETHLKSLLDEGYRIAIAEQIEEPETVSGVAERAVTRIITPGTLTESELLNPQEYNFVASITSDTTPVDDTENAAYSLAFLDVSTGAFYHTTVRSIDDLRDELSRVNPVEVILEPSLRHDEFTTPVFQHLECTLTDYTPAAFQDDAAREKTCEYFGDLQGAAASDDAARAIGALLDFAEYTRGGTDGYLNYISDLNRYDPTEYLLMDDTTLRGLEVFERRTDQSPDGATLIEVVDRCVSALGSRKIRDWLRRPLLSKQSIEYRQAAVAELTQSSFTREELREALENVYDIERLTTRISRSNADARDIRALYDTLSTLPKIRNSLSNCEAEFLVEIREESPSMQSIRETIDDAIKDDPATDLTEGGVIKVGYSDELDALRAKVKENQEWIQSLEEVERERTGIDNLEVGHNQVHGYYIEVTESNLDKVPEEYMRRQTLKNAERYYTPELQDREDEIIAARERAHDLEYELFTQVRDELARDSDLLQTLASQIARLDAATSFAELAVYNDYTRPEIGAQGGDIQIEGGRHPVVEVTQDTFVPNDTTLTREKFLTVITGPNMSGKSTYLRQVALITLLAQCGSFVPAESAHIGLRDRIATRIGASDDITGGQSTFMMEMTEVADILETTTEDSLIILDEVGRGTSTADGFAIACAVTNHIHQDIAAFTLFATHHHELTQHISQLDGARNMHFSSEHHGDEVVYHYNIKEGPATGSYGIEVARDAGVPDDVIGDAKSVLERDTETAAADSSSNAAPDSELTQSPKLDATEVTHPELASVLETHNPSSIAAIVRELETVSVNELPPIEALQVLADLRDTLEKGANKPGD